MTVLHVSSLPLVEVIQDISKGLNTTFKHENHFYWVDIPDLYGEGRITGVDFKNGFGLLNYQVKFNEQMTIEFTYDQVHPMKFMHCRDGAFVHHFEKDEMPHPCDKYENIIVASSKKNGHVLIFPANEKVEICSIEIDRAQFYKKVEHIDDENSGVLLDTIKDKKGAKKFYFKGDYSLVIFNIINDLLEERTSKVVDIFVKEGKSYEMLAAQWDQFVASYRVDDFNKKVNVKEYQLLVEIENYIEKNIASSIRIKDIEKFVGINEKKIQLLFKTAYDKTFNVYLQNYRMEKAMKLLQNDTHNISDVVHAVGLKNKSYFTRIFRATFNKTPSEFLREIKDKNN